MSQLGDSVTIAVVKNSVTFKASGDLGEGNITLLESTGSEKDDEKVRMIKYFLKSFAQSLLVAGCLITEIIMVYLF